MIQRDALVAELQQVRYRDVLASYPSVKLIEGQATFEPDGTLSVGGTPVRAKKILIATGARPWAPPIPGLDALPYLTSTEALSLTDLPHSLVVVGGGAVGLEIAQLYARLGTKVTVLEAQPRLVPAEDPDISAGLTTYLQQEGLAILDGSTGATARGESTPDERGNVSSVTLLIEGMTCAPAA